VKSSKLEHTEQKFEKSTNYVALYSYVNIELDNYIYLLNSIDERLQKPIKELNLIITYNKFITGLNNYVEKLLLEDFYNVKDFIFNMKKTIKKYEKGLDIYFIHNPNKKQEFDDRVNEINRLIMDNETFIDKHIDRAIDYINEYEKTFGLRVD